MTYDLAVVSPSERARRPFPSAAKSAPSTTEFEKLSPVGQLIFLDRYALKASAAQSRPKLGDMLICRPRVGKGTPTVGAFLRFEGEMALLEMADGSVERVPLRDCDKLVETAPSQMWARIARTAAAAETLALQPVWEARFRDLLAGWKLVPGGRILFGAGTPLPCNNCHVIPSPRDSRAGIMATLTEMSELMSHGAGVGINVSSLRPRGAMIRGVNGRSSGAVSWAELYSKTTGLIEEGGSRRGALMLILDIWHPDIQEFIGCKAQAGHLNHANISVSVSDAFMEAVRRGQPWRLVYPDTSDPAYDAEWTGDLKQWQAAGHAVIVYDEVDANDLWNRIVLSAWGSGEPGIFFADRYNGQSNSWYYAPILCTNPCAEQGLPAWGACNLAAINLPQFVTEGGFDLEALATSVACSVRLLDNLIDTTSYPLPASQEQQQRERRVGLGTMGLAEALLRLQIRYGSPECLRLVDELYKTIAVAAYTASIDLAREKGAFPMFQKEPYLESGFIRTLPQDLRSAIERHGIRNVTLLSQAPTGTIATMLGVSTGIEPYYSWSVERRSRLGVHQEVVPAFARFRETQGEAAPLPTYFVTAMDLSAQDHVAVQAAVQRWMDAAVSKTCNLPRTATPKQAREVYDLMYSLGCKGGTIFRDGSRDEQVLCAVGGDANQVCE